MRIIAPALLVSCWFLTTALAPAVGEENAAPAAAASKTEAPPPAAEQFTREEVTFQHGAVTLSGDLFTPIGPGPFPAFVWCHGSGAANRRWGMLLASTFVKAGCAFLTWDKPGVGKSSGRCYQQSLTNRADEVLAAAEMLKQRKEIDPDRISFCGGSQAGYVLPRAIKAFPKAERLVLIGPASSSFSEELAYQQKTEPVRKYLPMVGMNPKEVDEVIELSEKLKLDYAPESEYVEGYLRFHQEAKEKSWYSKLLVLAPAPPVGAADLEDFKRYFREVFAFNAIQEYAEIHCPTLILFGALDECVNPKAGLANIRAGFGKSGNPGLSVIVYPVAGHGLDGAGDKPKEDLLKWLTGPLDTCSQSATPSPPH